MLTDCSSIQGSTASSSSDVMTLTTTSSWCAIAIPASASARLRIVRLIRPHARRILVTPDTSPSFGFAVRGGKEYGTGFFVSSVERNSEAELKGMRIGDQILRINGFRVDDAVHREFIQFITNQDRITLKVRSVGMLPIKDKESDKLTWHVVKANTLSSAASEHSFKSFADRDTRSKDINVVLNVAPRTKLGLGICKGPEWKPGIFVQFTKEKSVAREAGLRPGDQILSVNSIDFSDVLFSEAVAVMKSASKLEMVVRTAAGCDLFPGESSGYNSSASSVTGDQSPCWADAKSKRLTAVCEEPTAAGWNEQPAEQRRNVKRNDLECTTKQQGNKTIIKLSESGTSINNTYITNLHENNNAQSNNSEFSLELPPPPPPLTATNSSSVDGCYMTRERETKTIVVEVHRHEAEAEKRQHQHQHLQQHQQHRQNLQYQYQRSSAPAAQDNRSHYHHNLQPASSLPIGATKATELQKCSRLNSYSQHSANQSTSQSHNHSHSQLQSQSQSQSQNQNQSQSQCRSRLPHHGCNGRNIDGNSSLSSAITEELKKRKEKQRINAAIGNNNSNNHYNNNSNNNNLYANCKQNNYGPSRHELQQQHQQPQQTLRQQVSLKHTPSKLPPTTTTTLPISASTSSASLASPASPSPSTLTLTSARATSSAANCNERNSSDNSNNNNSNSNNSYNNSSSNNNNSSNSVNNSNNNNNNNTNHCGRAAAAATTIAGGVGVGVGVGVSAGAVDQHSALMDEFKRAHQRMFKNGFHETERKERQEALRNTTMMEDEVNHRASRLYRNENSQVNNTISATQFNMPPPPPQFASAPQQQQQQHTGSNNISNNTAAAKHHTKSMAATMSPKPPSSPVPDYDNVEIRTKSTTATTTSSTTAATSASNSRPSYGYATPNVITNGRDSSNSAASVNGSGNRRTMRLGTVTIGEYEQPQQRKEPAKFDFVSTQKRNSTTVTDGSLHTELQNTLTRSQLKKSAEPMMEHQSNCPLRSNYENYENVARKLHGMSVSEGGSGAAPTLKSSTTTTITNGILKNGNGSRSSSNGASGNGNLTKNSDKTITFGN